MTTRPGSIRDRILDEIGLEGLDGLSIEGLWIRLSTVLELSSPLPDMLCGQVWQIIKREQQDKVLFYELPSPRAKLKIFNRQNNIDPVYGLPLQFEECPFTTYKLNPIDKDGVRGSCEDYDVRKEIPFEEIKDLSLADINERWGAKFILVGTQTLRESSIFPRTLLPFEELSILQYCILERIGRSRYNGEVSMGKHSLLQFITDPKQMFYLRKMLIKLQLITKQIYSEKLQQLISTGFLFMLPRFFSEFKTKPMFLFEIIIETLRSKPNGMAELHQIRGLFDESYITTYKKLMLTQIFRKFIETKLVPYRELYPDAPQKKWQNGHKRERILRVHKLKNPNLTIDDIWTVAEGMEDEEKKPGFEFQNPCNNVLDVPLLYQIYNYIDLNGSNGTTEPEIIRHLALKRCTNRQLIKRLSEMGLITSYYKEFGKTKQRRFVTYKHGAIRNNLLEIKICDESDQEVPAEPAEPPSKSDIAGTNIQCADFEPDKNDPNRFFFEQNNTQFEFKFIPEMLTYSKRVYARESFTVRQTQRAKFIENQVHLHQVVNFISLIRSIHLEEAKLGYQERFCRKSMNCYINLLLREGLVQVFKLTGKNQDIVKNFHFICSTFIDPNHVKVKSEVLKINRLLQNCLADRVYRARQKATIQMKAEKQQKSKIIEFTNTRLCTPKMARFRKFHELLFYLAYNQPFDLPVIPVEEAIDYWIKNGPQEDFCELLSEMPPLYSLEINDRMFLPPLPALPNFPKGWTSLKDILLRIPLSTLSKIYNLPYTPEVKEFLAHPIRQHYLLETLPVHIQGYIRTLTIQAHLITDVISRLRLMGLIQVHHQAGNNFYIYLNRRAMFFDTSTSDRGYDQVSTDREYPRIDFVLNTMTDIAQYWDQLCHFSHTSNLGMNRKGTGKRKRFGAIDHKLPPPIEPDEAALKDVGILPGDRLGACGMDKTLYVHVKRNWWARKKVIIKKRIAKQKITFRMAKLVKRKDSVNQNKRIKCRLVTYPKNRPQRPKTEQKLRQKYDPIDMEALKRMNKLRVQWSPGEDHILQICRVAMQYLNIAAHRNLLFLPILRDVVHWSQDGLNKTSQACRRRICFMMKNPAINTRVQLWRQEIEQNHYINQVFGLNFLNNLRKVFPKNEDFTAAGRIFCVQLIYYLTKVLKHHKNESNRFLPDTMNEFRLLYKEKTPQSQPCMFPNPTNRDELDISTLGLLIHSSTSCARDKTIYKFQLFDIYKSYKDEIVAAAFNHLKDHQMVKLQKCIATGKRAMAPSHGKTYYFSQIYSMRFVTKLPYQMIAQVYESFENMVGSLFGEQQKTSNQSIEFTSCNAGTAFFVAELAANLQMDFKIQTPRNVLKVDPQQETDSFHSEKLIDRFREFFQMPDYSKQFDDDQRDHTRRRLRFNFSFDILKISYHPYDKISKLPDSKLHLFCLLKHLNEEISLEFPNSFDCPFQDCVMLQMDYLLAIQSIIEENKDLISTLVTQGERVAEISFDENVTITKSTILEINNQLQSHLSRNSVETDKRDFGKSALLCRKEVILLDLLSEILTTSEEDVMDSQQESEQTVNRDEFSDKVSRLQDILVVNTPKLNISYKSSEAEKFVDYKNIQVPEKILLPICKDELLHKIQQDSQWQPPTADLKSIMMDQSFTAEEIDFTENVLDFIMSNELGIPAKLLVAKFKNQKLLLKVLRILSGNKFVKRLGVATISYVHHKYVHQWIVKTYNIKRLEKEALGDMKNLPAPLKRKSEESAAENEAKRPKLQETGGGKRISKPVARFSDKSVSISQEPKTIDIEKLEKIYMRPCPWIRVSGSVNRRVLDKWLGTILMRCILGYGQLFTKLCSRFNFLHPVNIFYLLEILRDIGGINLSVLPKKRVNLFSDLETNDEEDATELSNFDEVFIKVKPGAVQLLGLFIGDKKYRTEFM